MVAYHTYQYQILLCVSDSLHFRQLITLSGLFFTTGYEWQARIVHHDFLRLMALVPFDDHDNSKSGICCLG